MGYKLGYHILVLPNQVILIRVLSRNKFLGGSLSITVNDCAQDMHIDLMHVLYVYSRVMRGEGGGGTYKV